MSTQPETFPTEGMSLEKIQASLMQMDITSVVDMLQCVDMAYMLKTIEEDLSVQMEKETRELRAHLASIEARYKSELKAAATLQEQARAFLGSWLSDNPHNDSIQGRHAKASLRAQECVQIHDSLALPFEFVSPNMARIRACLKAGMEVPGARVVTNKILEIRKV